MPDKDNKKPVDHIDGNSKSIPEIKPLNESTREFPKTYSDKGRSENKWDVQDTSTPIKKDYSSNSTPPKKEE